MDTAQATVTVYPNPTADLTLSDAQGCHPLTAQLTNLSTGADQYLWNYGDGSTSDTTQAVHGHTWYNYAGPGPIRTVVSLTALTSHGCSSTVVRNIEVFPQVVAAFVADSAGCAPLPVQFVNVSSGANTYAWTFGDGQFSASSAPQHTYFAPRSC